MDKTLTLPPLFDKCLIFCCFLGTLPWYNNCIHAQASSVAARRFDDKKLRNWTATDVHSVLCSGLAGPSSLKSTSDNRFFSLFLNEHVLSLSSNFICKKFLYLIHLIQTDILFTIKQNKHIRPKNVTERPYPARKIWFNLTHLWQVWKFPVLQVDH